MIEIEKFLLGAVLIAGAFVVLINIGFALLKKRPYIIPGYETKLRNIKRQHKLKEKIPEQEGTLIGFRNKRPIYTRDNAKHIFVCGTTGSGKSVALSNYIKRSFDVGYPALIIDGKGDMGEGSILDMVTQFKNRKTYIINLNSPETSDKYNPFKNANPTVAKDMLINLTSWSEEHYKLNTERYLQKVISLMVLKEVPLSFESIVKNIDTERFITLSMDLKKNEIISKEEHTSNVALSKTSGEIAESAAARFSLLLESELGTIFDEKGIDISIALQEQAIIVFILNPLLYPETSALMGRLILIDSKKAVSHLYDSKTFKKESQRSFFILDEINSFASPVLIDLVNKSRSAGVTCILATQSLSDLDSAVDENFKEQIIENCNNYIVLRQNSAKNAEHWANIIGTEEAVKTTYQLGEQGGISAPTGAGSIHFTKEYIFHPDEIKNLKLGEAFFVSKDTGVKFKLYIHKPF